MTSQAKFPGWNLVVVPPPISLESSSGQGSEKGGLNPSKEQRGEAEPSRCSGRLRAGGAGDMVTAVRMGHVGFVLAHVGA